MTIQSLKRSIARLLTAGFLAGAVALAVPSKADAQVGVFVGPPRVGYPIFTGDYRFRGEEFRRREEWRHERFDHRFYGRYDRRFDRRF